MPAGISGSAWARAWRSCGPAATASTGASPPRRPWAWRGGVRPSVFTAWHTTSPGRSSSAGSRSAGSTRWGRSCRRRFESGSSPGSRRKSKRSSRPRTWKPGSSGLPGRSRPTWRSRIGGGGVPFARWLGGRARRWASLSWTGSSTGRCDGPTGWSRACEFWRRRPSYTTARNGPPSTVGRPTASGSAACWRAAGSLICLRR